LPFLVDLHLTRGYFAAVNSSSNFSLFALFAFGCFNSLLCAQQANEENQSSLEKAAPAAAKTAAKVPAPPLPAGNAKLKTIRERVKAIQKKQAQYLADVASGKIIPQAHLREMRPRQVKQVNELQKSYQQLQTEKDPKKADLISKALLAGLQPFGPHLKTAAVGKGYLNYLSKQQQAELQKLESDWDAADRDYNTKAKPLSFLGTGEVYTLTNLSVPLIVEAPPFSTVIFRTHAGGFFSNKLAYQAVQANKAGIAQADWVTYGGSIGDTIISARCKEAPPAQNLTITTVRLQLHPLPDLPKVQVQPPAQPKLDLQKKTDGIPQ
jgi:hypothetical protein